MPGLPESPLRDTDFRGRPWRSLFEGFALCVLWIGSLALGYLGGSLPGAGPTRLSFLAVGQGDCAVFQHAGAAVLIDAGPGDLNTDVGRRIVWPKLRERGIARVDLVLLTHPDADHIAGLRSLRRTLPIRKVATPVHFRGEPEMAKWLAEIGMKEDEVLWIAERAVVEVGSFRLRLECPKRLPSESDNEGSLFVKIEGEGASAVLTGDASEQTELTMLRRLDWSAEVLKAGHHGSKTSTGDAWLSAVRPRHVVFSSGRSNRYGHPAPEVVERAQRRGAQVARTDTEGDIVFEVRDGDFVRVR